MVLDGVQNSGAAEAKRVGMGCKALFAANSPAIGNKSNAADRPSPRYSGPAWLLNTIPSDGRIVVLWSPLRQRWTPGAFVPGS
jgi:hypothetical protein